MKHRTLAADLMLFCAALIWGIAFVPQKTVMDHIGPFTFNGIRFGMAALMLLPVIAWQRRAAPRRADATAVRSVRALWIGGLFTGLFLFLGIALQQTGMLYTTAGKGGFISGLYVIPVAMLSVVAGSRLPWGTWLGALVALVGLYLLAVPTDFSVNRGDILVLISILFWTGQILLVSHYSNRVGVLALAAFEFIVCSILSLIVAYFLSPQFEPISLARVLDARWELLYTGLISAGFGYSFQIAGQRHAPPTHAAIIMSLETVFAALAGWVLLHEVLGPRGLAGCALMLAGMIISQLAQLRATPAAPPAPNLTTPAPPHP
ncbi:MAG: DMT family transporter [Phycisphaeraceae bacterium]|nr:DMT family transporter [Phycisphaeraceae bacterium]